MPGHPRRRRLLAHRRIARIARRPGTAVGAIGPPGGAYRDALVEDGIPLAQFAVDDIAAEHARLTSKGVVFTQPPTDIGTAFVAVFDDTCGNLIQLIEGKPDENHADAR